MTVHCIGFEVLDFLVKIWIIEVFTLLEEGTTKYENGCPCSSPSVTTTSGTNGTLWCHNLVMNWAWFCCWVSSGLSPLLDTDAHILQDFLRDLMAQGHYFSVLSDVPVDNEVSVVILSILIFACPTQFFECSCRGRVCIRAFIEVSICSCTWVSTSILCLAKKGKFPLKYLHSYTSKNTTT